MNKQIKEDLYRYIGTDIPDNSIVIDNPEKNITRSSSPTARYITK